MVQILAQNVFSAALLTCVAVAACSADAPAPAGVAATDTPRTQPASTPAQPSGEIADAPIEQFRLDLLDLAFRAASAMPLDPHLKNRSRYQDLVVTTCLELEQPARALAYADQIANWRRGAGHADYAHYCATRGAKQPALDAIAVASRVADLILEEENAQAWRRDRIRAKVARAHLAMGDVDRARTFMVGLDESVLSQLADSRAASLRAEDVAAELATVDQAVETSSFDRICAALASCVRLFDRFYHEPELRAAAADRVIHSYDRLPLDLRIRLVLELGELSNGHGDHAEAMRFVNLARARFDSASWRAEHAVPLLARIAEVRATAGDALTAQSEIHTALDRFASEQRTILDIDRADVLRPVAECMARLGRRQVALETFAKVVDVGALNPNARPRVEDLVLTCCALARLDLKPDAALQARIQAVLEGLESPW